MKAAGYIFLGLLLAILLYVSVERFTVTIQSDGKDTTPVVTRMDAPIPTSATSTTATLAAPVEAPPPPPPPPNPIVERIASLNAQREQFMRTTVTTVERERSIATSAYIANRTPENESRVEAADIQHRAAIDSLNEIDRGIQQLTQQLTQQ